MERFFMQKAYVTVRRSFDADALSIVVAREDMMLIREARDCVRL